MSASMLVTASRGTCGHSSQGPDPHSGSLPAHSRRDTELRYLPDSCSPRGVSLPALVWPLSLYSSLRWSVSDLPVGVLLTPAQPLVFLTVRHPVPLAPTALTHLLLSAVIAAGVMPAMRGATVSDGAARQGVGHSASMRQNG